MKQSKILNLFCVAVMSLLVGVGVDASLAILAPSVAINPLVPAGVFLVSTMIPKPAGVLGAVTVELWADYIIKKLWKDNQFLARAYNDDQYVLGGSVVHVPQPGASPSVVKNRAVFPAVAVRRSDTDLTYPLDVYTTDPTHIPKAELMEISYDKIDSVLGEHMDTLKEVIGDEMLYKWAADTAASILRTNGAAVGAHTGSATGNRKIFLKEDLKNAQTLFNGQGVPKDGRVALFDSELLSQLQDDDDLKKRDNGMELDMKNGVIMRLYGFDIMERSTTTIYTNAGTPVAKAVGAAGAATDNAAVQCYHKDSVARAIGSIDFFEKLNDPTYYGDVYSAQVKFGGRKRRADNKGICTIVQAAI